MKLIKVAAAVLNQTPRDWKGNKHRIIKAIRMAKEQNVTVLCLPEATITGYGMEDDYFCEDVTRRAMVKLTEIIGTLDDDFHVNTHRICEKLIFCIGLPIRFNNSLYNSVATVVNGRIVGFTCKQHLAGDGIHYENRWFKPWPKGVVQKIFVKELNQEFPIGDLHFEIGGIKIGYEICEDAWVAGRPGTILATKGVDIYLNPSASHFSFGKLQTRKNFVVDGSRAFNATYIYTNLVGNEAGRAIYDGGALIASGGNLLATGERLTYKSVSITSAIVDIDTTRTQNVRTASFEPDTKHYYDGCISIDFNYPKISNIKNSEIQYNWEFSETLKHEECTRAISLALMDYMRKSHTKGFVISLSGGADSSMVTYLCSMGIEIAVRELGLDKFISKYCPFITDKFENVTRTEIVPKGVIKYLCKRLITTVYQGTAQSSDITRTAARKLAEFIGTTHYDFNVEELVNVYSNIIKTNIGKTLNFKDNGLVLQNLQARVRAPGVWVLANMEGKMLLTTSNMSEAAVGYATMDGDTAGSLAPIAGIPKCYIREYLNWVEKKGPLDYGNVPVMKLVNNQQPTAELLPKEFNQTDEKDLMPYWLLHRIETLVVKNRYVPVEVYQELKATTDYDNNDLIDAITKFFKLFSINQWKRERYAVSFHLDDHNLDPRTWCRMPILSGGYEEELEELTEYLTLEKKN